MEKDLTKVSKYLSYLLRHKPEAVGVVLDEQGWASVDELIEKTVDFELSVDLLRLVVETNDKQRFCLSDDGTRIRANQGHSIDVDLALQPQEPPEVLLHGTAERFWGSIEDNGLEKRGRHHVHLSVSESVAMSVGQRYGTPVLLEIAAGKMFRDGFEFFRTANNVWLVDHVPVRYLKLIGHEKCGKG